MTDKKLPGSAGEIISAATHIEISFGCQEYSGSSGELNGKMFGAHESRYLVFSIWTGQKNEGLPGKKLNTKYAINSSSGESVKIRPKAF